MVSTPKIFTPRSAIQWTQSAATAREAVEEGGGAGGAVVVVGAEEEDVARPDAPGRSSSIARSSSATVTSWPGRVLRARRCRPPRRRRSRAASRRCARRSGRRDRSAPSASTWVAAWFEVMMISASKDFVPSSSVCVHDLPQDLDGRKEGMELRLSRERLAEIDDSAGHILLAGRVDVAGAERPRLAGVRLVGVPPDATRVIRQQVDRHGGLRARSSGRDGCRRAAGSGRRSRPGRALGAREVETSLRAGRRPPPPGCRGRGRRGPRRGGRERASPPRRNDEAEQREAAVARAEEQPLPDPAAHPAFRGRRLVLLREPVAVGEELREAGPDRLARLLGRVRAGNRRAHVRDERAHGRRGVKVLVFHG